MKFEVDPDPVDFAVGGLLKMYKIAAIELVQSSRSAETGIQHFAVYPGPPGFVDPEIHSTFHEARPIPLPTWNRNA